MFHLHFHIDNKPYIIGGPKSVEGLIGAKLLKINNQDINVTKQVNNNTQESEIVPLKKEDNKD